MKITTCSMSVSVEQAAGVEGTEGVHGTATTATVQRQ